MNDLIAVLRTRRSPSLDMFTGAGPDEPELQTLLTVASRVPDHGKIAPWRFIVFTGEARERAGALIADVYATENPDAEPRRIEAERRRLLGAPLVICVVSRPVAHPKVPEWEQVLSAGAVCTSLLVAATTMGFGALWLTEWYGYNKEVLGRLGLGADERVAGFIHIGRTSGVREDSPRPPLDAIVARF